jgi:hypothetical protein
VEVFTRYEETPINMYKIVQTTGKIHPGGDKAGFLISG